MNLNSLSSCFVLSFFISNYAYGALPLNKIPPEIKLEGSSGQKVGGGIWSSKELSGKTVVLFYSAPQAKDWNNEAREAIRKENFFEKNFASYAVVNMKASNWPNFLISSELTKSQKENPRTNYVEDKEKILVKEWGLADHSNNIVVFGKDGKIIFSVDGKLNQNQIQDLISIIKKDLYEKPKLGIETF